MAATADTRTGARTFQLDELVRLAWDGRIRIPHFQRNFRWARSDVIQLVDSIRRGYPVGNLLLWERPAVEADIDLGSLRIHAPKSDRAIWVVDGQQRVTSLANVLSPHTRHDSRFALGYDLHKEQIVPLPDEDDSFIVPLPVIFDLTQVLTWFADRPDAADLRDVAFTFARDLRQYTIPAYQVEQDNVQVLKEIFDRLNNSGKKLRRAEVFYALNAGTEDTDQLSLQRIAERIHEKFEFGLIHDDTVLQCILARRGSDIQREIRVEFDPSRRRGAVDFPDENSGVAYAEGEKALEHAVEFLRSTGVPHYAMLPYRYLLVVLTRFLALHPEPEPAHLRLLHRWFWRAAVAGPVIAKGSATGTTRALTGRINRNDASASLQGLLEAVKLRSELDPRRFRTNDGTGKIITCSLWHRQPRNPETGHPYSVGDLTGALAESVTPAEGLRPVFAVGKVPADKRLWSANRVLMPVLGELPSTVAVRRSLEQQPMHVSDSNWDALLESHGIGGDAQRALINDAGRFLTIRQARIAAELLIFLDLKCEWGYENTPPLVELVLDDLDSDGSDDTA